MSLKLNFLIMYLFPELRGLIKQNDVGFLALLEHLRYCEVGSFFKNPKHPVWVVGSETHLTGKEISIPINILYPCLCFVSSYLTFSYFVLKEIFVLFQSYFLGRKA